MPSRGGDGRAATSRAGRRRLRTPVAAAAVVALAAAVLWWQLSRFPAQGEELPGTAVRLEVQDGVPRDQADSVRAGLVAQAGQLADPGEAPLTDEVVVRMSWSRGCRPPWLGPRSVSAAWAEPGFVCLNPAHPGWTAAAEADQWYPAYVSAHELVHAWQAELGCHREAGDHEWLWLFEGMADQLAFSALEDAGIVDEGTAPRRIRTLGGLDPALGSLADHERRTAESAAAYPLFHLGARALVGAGAGPADFAAFCRSEASGTPWRDAFVAAFGLSVDDLYGRVEAERRALAADV